MPRPGEEQPAFRNPDLSPEARVADCLARMSLEEKVAQLFCVGRAVEMTDILLEPGQTESVEFVLTPDKLALLDRDMCWRVEAGLFEVMVGGSSEALERVTLEVVAWRLGQVGPENWRV